MGNALYEEFSRQEDEQIRSNIERIISSYRHVWDIYTELLQNSADAVFSKFTNNLEKGIIELNIYPSERKIVIEDNGIGISEDNLSKILVTGKSIKRTSKIGKFGFMGFGFTFVAFQSCYLKIESTHNNKFASRTYRNLYKYVFEGKSLPNSDEEVESKSSIDVTNDSGTKITLIFPIDFPQETTEESLMSTFRLANNEEAIIAVLRTKTIVGYLEPLFSKKKMFNFKLLIEDKEIIIDSGYLTNREIVEYILNSDNRFYNRSTYEKFIKATDHLPSASKDDARKAILIDEIIEHIEIGVRKKIRARVYITATSKFNINQYNSFLKTDNASDSDLQIENGLWLAIDGMPIGVCLDSFDHASYLPFTVIVDIQDNCIRKELDAGRKGISEHRKKQITQKVKSILVDKNYIKYSRYVVGTGGSRISKDLYDPKKELQKRFTEKFGKESLLVTQFFPPIEEQEVLTLFIDLLANNLIIGYTPEIISSYQVYDGLMNYSLKKDANSLFSKDNPLGILNEVFNSNGNFLEKEILVEFKQSVEGIYRDIATNKKDMSHIDILICWDVNYDNKSKILLERGDIIEEVDRSTNAFFGVTHHLFGNIRQQKLPIIELKAVLNMSVFKDDPI